MSLVDTILPTYNDVIIPDPSFDIRDMMHFECIRLETDKHQISTGDSSLQIDGKALESIKASFINAAESDCLPSSLLSVLSVLY